MLEKDRLRDICELYYSDVFRFSLHFLRDGEKAKDVTQETFLLLNKKAEELEDSNIKSWLFSSAYRIIKSQWRASQAQLMKFEETTEEIQGSLIEEEIVRENMLRFAKEAISSLGEKDRQLYDMRFAENMTFSQIAKITGESENAIYVRVHRLRGKVIDYIRDKILL